ASVGLSSPRQPMISSNSTPAINVRPAIRVTGGMVATPSLMKVYDTPHKLASRNSSASSAIVPVRGEQGPSIAAIPFLGGNRGGTYMAGGSRYFTIHRSVSAERADFKDLAVIAGLAGNAELPAAIEP